MSWSIDVLAYLYPKMSNFGLSCFSIFFIFSLSRNDSDMEGRGEWEIELNETYNCCRPIWIFGVHHGTCTRDLILIICQLQPTESAGFPIIRNISIYSSTDD